MPAMSTSKKPQIETPALTAAEDKSLTPVETTAPKPEATPEPAPAPSNLVSVTLAHFWGDHAPGDTITVDIDVAGELLRGGILAS